MTFEAIEWFGILRRAQPQPYSEPQKNKPLEGAEARLARRTSATTTSCASDGSHCSPSLAAHAAATPGLVKALEVGFEYSQAGWLVVGFDTRPNTEPAQPC